MLLYGLYEIFRYDASKKLWKILEEVEVHFRLRDDAIKLYDISLKNLRELRDGQNILIVILELSKVFFKDSNIILKYSILGDCFGLKKTCL